jgi:MSHA biogenesis protein MshK
MARDLIALLCALGALAIAGPAGAQAPAQVEGSTLPDPTRPPASVGATQGNSGTEPIRPPLLQSVFISPERKWALIGGQHVALGGKFGDARLISLTEEEAILQGPQGRTILRLMPDVQRTPSAATRGDAGK